MNPKIEELYWKCNKVHGDYSDGGKQVLDVEKFAELIIRECENLCQHRANVLQKHLDKRGIDMDETAFYFAKGVISGSIRNAQRIRGLLNNEPKN